MKITSAMRWPDFVTADRGQSALQLIAHPGGAAASAELLNSTNSAREFFLAVGPEGGFTAAELQQALDRNWRPIDLGPRILRVETAALALIALCNF